MSDPLDDQAVRSEYTLDGSHAQPVPLRSGGYARSGMYNIQNHGPGWASVMSLIASESVIDASVVTIAPDDRIDFYALASGGEYIAVALVETGEGARLTFDPPRIA
jgi:hypothetical protein